MLRRHASWTLNKKCWKSTVCLPKTLTKFRGKDLSWNLARDTVDPGYRLPNLGMNFITDTIFDIWNWHYLLCKFPVKAGNLLKCKQTNPPWVLNPMHRFWVQGKLGPKKVTICHNLYFISKLKKHTDSTDSTQSSICRTYSSL